MASKPSHDPTEDDSHAKDTQKSLLSMLKNKPLKTSLILLTTIISIYLPFRSVSPPLDFKEVFLEIVLLFVLYSIAVGFLFNTKTFAVLGVLFLIVSAFIAFRIFYLNPLELPLAKEQKRQYIGIVFIEKKLVSGVQVYFPGTSIRSSSTNNLGEFRFSLEGAKDSLMIRFKKGKLDSTCQIKVWDLVPKIKKFYLASSNPSQQRKSNNDGSNRRDKYNKANPESKVLNFILEIPTNMKKQQYSIIVDGKKILGTSGLIRDKITLAKKPHLVIIASKTDTCFSQITDPESETISFNCN